MSRECKLWAVLIFWAALILWTSLILLIGFAIGDKSANQSAEKEIIELSIELTKLEIKKLRGGE